MLFEDPQVPDLDCLGGMYDTEYKLPEISALTGPTGGRFIKKEPLFYHEPTDKVTSCLMQEYTPFGTYELADVKPVVQKSPALDTPAVEKMVFAQIQRDVAQDANTLGIPTAPQSWTPSDTRIWLCYVAETHNLPKAPMNPLAYDGQTLCTLSEEQFSLLCGSTDIASKVISQLEVWKTASKTNMFFHPQQQLLQQQPQHPIQSDMLPPMPQPTWSPPHGCSSGPVSPYVSPVPSPNYSHSSSDYYSSDTESNDAMPKYPVGIRRPGHKHPVHLWEFLRELLLTGNEDCIRWLDSHQGIFKIQDSARVAKLWGLRKNRPAMNYDKLSRSIRQYYKKGIIKKTAQSKRLIYQFCEPYLSS